MERCGSVFLILTVMCVSSWSLQTSEIRSLQKRSLEVADQLRLENELKRVKRLQEDEELSRVKRFKDNELSRQKRTNENGENDALKRVKRLKRAVLENKLKKEIALHRMKRGEVSHASKHASNKLSNSENTKQKHGKSVKQDFKKKRMEMAMKRHGNLGKHRVMKKGDPRFHHIPRNGHLRHRMMNRGRFHGNDRKHHMRNILKRHHVQHHRSDVKKPKRHIKRS